MNYFFKFKLPIIFLLALVLRIISIYYYRDTEIANEWGIIVENLLNNNILSVHSVQGVPVPNIFMPPLYPLFLYSIKIFFNNTDIFLWVIQYLQLFFAIITIYLANKILLEFFSENLSAIGTLIYAIFPLNVYAVSQISSITLQILLLNIFIYSFLKLFKKIEYLQIFLFTISSALLMLLRGEFFIFVILSIIYLYLKQKSLTKILLISLITLLIISPYLYRNYNIFGVITITKSGGYNLLKGNNPRTKPEGTPMFLSIEKVIPEVKSKLDELNAKGPSSNYDLAQDKILLNQAIKFIKSNPLHYLMLYIKKILSFMFIDINASYSNYYSPLHIIPKLFLGVTTLIGIILSFNLRVNAQNFVTLYYFANIGLFSVFFILPRYSLSLLMIQIILSLFVLKKLKPKL
ncbi:glycosyltransferase family 39 protein [Pelagibacteraceae bacterium]|nr:glycosyltransferase family 39 protein [Pelagibacteraceae bacterium]MDC1130439.1 glycosyltransferase family 39 protein [Pelagibacteraceae bacterium]